MKTLGQRFWSKVDIADGCWNWTASKTKDGYGNIGANGKVVRAHRLCYEMEKGPIPEGLHVLHKCDNPSCVNPAHLWIGINYDNVKDRDKKGRQVTPLGQYHGKSKTDMHTVRSIKCKLKDGISAYQIAREHNVPPRRVYDIKYGNCWRHVKC